MKTTVAQFLLLISLLASAASAFAGEQEANQAIQRQKIFKIKGKLVASSVIPGYYVEVGNDPGNPLLNSVLGFNESATVIASGDGHAHVSGEIPQLTADEERNFRGEVMRSIDTSKLIKYVFGKGERKLFMVTAWDCPACIFHEKRLTKFAPKLNATVYLIPTVLKATRSSLSLYNAIACSANPIGEWRKAMTERKFPTKLVDSCGSPTLMDTHIASLALGAGSTPSVFQEDGTKAESSYMDDDAALIRLFSVAGKADLRGDVYSQASTFTVANAFKESNSAGSTPQIPKFFGDILGGFNR